MASLFFERKEFQRGTFVIEDREVDENGELVVVKKAIPFALNRKRVEISDPEYVLQKYPAWFFKRKPK